VKAIVITRPGGPEVLETRDVADPVCGPEEVLVEVHATALNRADLLQRRGRYPAPPGAPPDIPGLEFAGEISRCGERVTSLRPGDRVMGLLAGGGYAERVAIHERLCMSVPPSIDNLRAAAIPEAFLTAYDALFRRGDLAAGERVLIHAAASGIGTAALQLAGAAGARTIALSRAPRKRRRLEELGADRSLDPEHPELSRLIRDGSGGRGVDLVIDLVGGPMLDLNLEVLAGSGRLVVVGLLGGTRAEIDLGRLIRHRLTVVGTVLRSRPLEEKISLVREFSRRMLPLFAAGRLRPVIDRTLPLAEAQEAHAVMERNENLGKIVLTLG